MSLKKILSVLLICIFLFGFSELNSGGIIAEEGESSSNDPMHLTWVGHGTHDGLWPDQDHPAIELLNKRFNVNIEVIEINNLEAETWNIWLASGGSANYMSIATNSNEARELVKQGTLREFPTEWLEEYMPAWMAQLTNLVGEDIVSDGIYIDGKSYTVPWINAAYMQSGVMIARKDWMDNLGIEEPTTIEEYHDMLYAFTHDDPDGNGLDDTYGTHGGQRYHFNYVYGAYGIMPDTWMRLDDGTITFSNITDEYREVLSLLAEWNNEGLFDPEQFVDDRSQQRAKWASGKIGVLPDNAFWVSVQDGNGILPMVLEQNPDAEFLFLKPFTGPDGKSGSSLDYPDVLGQASFGFGADTTDDQVKKIMEIREECVKDFDLFATLMYGIEGEDWSYDENEVIVVSEDANQKNILNYYFALQPVTFDVYKHMIPFETWEVNQQTMEQPYIYSGINFFAPSENTAKTELGTDVDTLSIQYRTDVINGRVDIESTWDDYVASLREAGVDRIVDEYIQMVP